MTTVGTIFLALALLATLLYVPIAFTIRPLAGPDAMELAGVFFLSVARWIFLLVPLLTGVARGGFSWIHPNRGLQALAVTALLAAWGALEIWSVSAATGWYGREGRPWVGAFAVLLPLFLIVLGAAALDPVRFHASVRFLRGGTAAILLLMATGTIVLGAKNHAASAEARAYRQGLEAEERRVHEEKVASLQALGPESRLSDWLAFTQDSDDEVREKAVASIRARPRLNEELAQILHSDDPLPALRWLWLWSAGNYRPELARPVYEAAERLPEWAGRLYDDSDPVNDGDVSTACEALVVLSDAFPGSGLDWRSPLEKIRAFLSSRALPEDQLSSDPTYQPRSLVQSWFNAHTTAEKTR